MLAVDPPTAPPGPGPLVLIGGAEGRDGRMAVLAHVAALACAAGKPRVVVLSAASNHQAEAQQAYAGAFAALGLRECQPLVIEQRAQADAPAATHALRDAGLVFLTGGDQRRLVARVAGTRLEAALHEAWLHGGACLAGTSAGAAALSACMLAEREPGGEAPAPATGAGGAAAGPGLSPGLGLLPGLVIDQHFTQRQRLRRLLQAIAAQPALLGVGIDEDTALHLAPDGALAVVGHGSVALVDGAHATPGATVDALRLHRLTAGWRLAPGPLPAGADPALATVLHRLRMAVPAWRLPRG